MSPLIPRLKFRRWLVQAIVAAALCCVAQSVFAQADDPLHHEWVAGDVRKEIADHYLSVLPFDWSVNQPEPYLNALMLVLVIPDWWNGNPVGAAMRYCPQHNSRIWDSIPFLTVRPFYHKRYWAHVECRP
ncbi:MAG TPA: hypothetical protein VGG27_03475 [Magnetospirillaceae bacterium]